MNTFQTKKRILVVERDQVTLELLASYFGPKGYEVVTFADAPTATLEVKSHPSKWDLLIMDLDEADTAAVEFTESFKRNYPNVPVVLMIPPGRVESGTVAQNSTFDYVVKPVQMPLLKVLIEKTMAIASLKQNLSELMQQLDFQKIMSGNMSEGRHFIVKVDDSLPELQQIVQKYIEFAVKRNNGAKDKTAKEIGIDRKTLYRKMKMAEENFWQ